MKWLPTELYRQDSIKACQSCGRTAFDQGLNSRKRSQVSGGDSETQCLKKMSEGEVTRIIP